ARGPLLADEPEAPWAAAERAAAERLVGALRHLAARAALEEGDAPTAADLAAAALAADPYDEAALRLLMRAQVAAGRPAAAPTAYARTRERLDEDLGTDPAPGTEAPRLAILRGGPLPGEAPAPATAARDDARSAAGRRNGLAAPAGATRGPAGPPGLPGRGAQLAALDAALRRVAAAGPLE